MKKTSKHLSKRERRLIKGVVFDQWQAGKEPVSDILDRAEAVAKFFARLNKHKSRPPKRRVGVEGGSHLQS